MLPPWFLYSSCVAQVLNRLRQRMPLCILARRKASCCLMSVFRIEASFISASPAGGQATKRHKMET